MDFCIGWSAVATWLASQSSNAKLQGCDDRLLRECVERYAPQWRRSYCASALIVSDLACAGNLGAVRPDLLIITISPSRPQMA
jgi:hypothetical protein